MGRILVAWFDRRNYPIPSGPIPDKLIADQLRETHASILELQGFLDGEYAEGTEGLNNPPRVWGHVIVSVQRWLATRKTTSSMDAKFERYRAKQRERQARAGGQNAQSR